MRRFLFILLLLAACTPVSDDTVAVSHVDSVDQWQRDQNDSRTVIDRAVLDDINNELMTETGMTLLPPPYLFNADLADASFLYLNPTRGFTVEFPYNENWGNTQYVIPPYYLYEEISEVRFGPLLYGADSGLSPAFILWYAEPRSAVDAEVFFEEEFEVDAQNVFIQAIGTGTGVVMRQAQEECPVPVIEVVGKTYNYVFSSTCEALTQWGADETLRQLVEVAETVQVQ